MSMWRILKEMITQHKKVKELEKEFRTHISNTFFGLISVEKGSMERRWGYPLLRHEHDWYLLNEIRGLENGHQRDHRETTR